MADSKQGNNEQAQTQLLQNYLDDLLFDVDLDDEVGGSSNTELLARTRSSEQQTNNANTGVSFNVNIGHVVPEVKVIDPRVSKRIQTQPVSLLKTKPELKQNLRNEPRRDLRSTSRLDSRATTKLETKSQVKTSSRPFVDVGEELNVLEEQKRQKLQSMLSQSLVKEALNKQLSQFDVVDKKILESEIDENVGAGEVKESLVNSEVTTEPGLNSDLKASQNTGEKITPILKWQKNGRPVWAQREFEVLMFEVNGLTLAVPLVALGQIVPLTDKLAPVFGQTDWFMGILPNKLGDIRVVNTALLVMPEKYNPEFVSTAGYVITIDGHRWGLAVDRVKQAFKLEPEAVKWRGERSKRAWLAGTVKDKMCVLIDIPQMALQLDGSDKNLHSGESND